MTGLTCRSAGHRRRCFELNGNMPVFENYFRMSDEYGPEVISLKKAIENALDGPVLERPTRIGEPVLFDRDCRLP